MGPGHTARATPQALQQGRPPQDTDSIDGEYLLLPKDAWGGVPIYIREKTRGFPRKTCAGPLSGGTVVPKRGGQGMHLGILTLTFWHHTH